MEVSFARTILLLLYTIVARIMRRREHELMKQLNSIVLITLSRRVLKVNGKSEFCEDKSFKHLNSSLKLVLMFFNNMLRTVVQIEYLKLIKI